LEFFFSFEEEIFEDYGNTLNYFYQKRPPVPVTPSDPLKDEFHKGTIKESTVIKGNGWLREVDVRPGPTGLCT
jgi:hypothetical protein